MTLPMTLFHGGGPLGWLSVFSRLLPQIFCRRARAWGTKFLSMPWEARVDLSHRALQHDHCAGLLPGDCVRFVGGTLVVIVVVDISTSGRAVLTAIGPSGVRRYRIRLLGGTDNQTHRPRRIGLCPCNMRHRQRGSARGQMQEFAAGKFQFDPPSRFTSLDDLVGEHEHLIGDTEAERLRGFEVNDQLELGWLDDRQGCWPFAFSDAPRLAAC